MLELYATSETQDEETTSSVRRKQRLPSARVESSDSTVNHLNQYHIYLFMELPPEPSVYTVYESKSRALIPKLTSLFVLSFIFYLGVLLNVSLLELSAEQETTLKTGSLILLLLLIILGTGLAVRKVKQPYQFYRNMICKGKETIFYIDINNTTAHLDPLDRLFKTYSINLGKNFFLRHIPQQIQLSNYIQQLVDYRRNRF